MHTRVAIICENVSLLSHLDGKNATGSSVYIAELSLYLSRNGFHIDIYNVSNEISITTTVDWMPGIKIFPLVTDRTATLSPSEKSSHLHITQLSKKLHSQMNNTGVKYAVIHAFSWLPAAVALPVSNEIDVPLVVTFDGLAKTGKDSFGENSISTGRIELEELVAANANQLIVTNIEEKETLVNFYHANQNKITVITGGYNPEEFKVIDKSLARTILGLREEENILLYSGQITISKGIETIIQALPLLETSQIKLIVIGGKSSVAENDKTEEIQRLKNMAIKLRVLPKILFAGSKNRNNLKFYYSAADVFITMPLNGSFSLAPIEAMACGTPVIATDIGSLKNAVAHSKTGFIVPTSEPPALAQKIDQVFSDNILMQSFQKNALIRARALFPWERVANMVQDLYLKILHPTAKSTPVIPIKRAPKRRVIS